MPSSEVWPLRNLWRLTLHHNTTRLWSCSNHFSSLCLFINFLCWCAVQTAWTHNCHPPLCTLCHCAAHWMSPSAHLLCIRTQPYIHSHADNRWIYSDGFTLSSKHTHNHQNIVVFIVLWLALQWWQESKTWFRVKSSLLKNIQLLIK